MCEKNGNLSNFIEIFIEEQLYSVKRALTLSHRLGHCETQSLLVTCAYTTFNQPADKCLPAHRT